MKTHEETWRAEFGLSDTGAGTACIMADGPATSMVAVTICGKSFDEIEARAQLAAQAPAMARLLLDSQWSEPLDARCSHCLNVRRLGHATDCELAAVLREAGLLP